MGIRDRLKKFMASPGANFFFLGGIWGIAAIPCLCPACLAGPILCVGRGVVEKVPVLKKLIG